MTRVDRTMVTRRLAVISRYVGRLAPHVPLTLDEYLADPLRQDGIERALQVSLEATLDVCKHFLRVLGVPRPKDAFDVIIAVGMAGVIPEALARALAPAASLRNRLVHEYDDLDDAKVHASIAKAVRLLPQFAAAVERYLDESSR